jgi:hypothetical protein
MCELLGFPEIVSVQKGQQLTARAPDAGISRSGYTLVFLADKVDAIGESQELVGGAVGGAVLYDDELIVSVGLVEHALDRCRDVSFVIVGGHNHADWWRHRAGPCPLT